MAVKTKAKLTSNPRIEELVAFLHTVDSISDIKVATHNDREDLGEDVVMEAHSNILFTYHPTNREPEERTLFVMEDVVDRNENSSLPPFVQEPYLLLSLGNWGHSTEILILIAEQFSGFVTPNDEDEDTFLTINGVEDFVFEPIAQELFDSLEGMTLKEKYEFVKNVEKNRDKIETYLNAMAV